MDADPDQTQNVDFTCGPRTYRHHNGIDIAVRDLRTADQSVFVVAAADGEVVFASAPHVDRGFVPNAGTPECGNAVIIRHDQGWETRYCHLKQDSVPVRKGNIVKAGQMIGEVGYSGSTTWPHLGFTVRRNKKPFDPFSGRTQLEGCGLDPKPLWIKPEAFPYQPFAIINLGFSVVPPNPAVIDTGVEKLERAPTNIPHLHFYVTSLGLQDGDRMELNIFDPENREMAYQSFVIEESETKAFHTITAKRGNGVWEPGIYRATVILKRGAGKYEQETAWQRFIELVRIEE